MKPGYSFFLNSILLGIGLAMDAFSVSCANALREPCMRRRRMCGIAGVYAFFQFLMPMAGWLCVHTIKERFSRIQWVIPWIALVLLVWIGGNMLLEGIREEKQKRYLESKRIQSEGSGPSASGSPFVSEASFASDTNSTSEASAASKACSESEACSATDSDSMSGTHSASGVLTVPTLLLQGIATSIDALSTGFTIAEYQFLMALAACLIIAAVTFVICMGGLVIGRKAGSRLSGKAGILGGVILIAIGLEIVITHYLT